MGDLVFKQLQREVFAALTEVRDKTDGALLSMLAGRQEMDDGKEAAQFTYVVKRLAEKLNAKAVAMRLWLLQARELAKQGE